MMVKNHGRGLVVKLSFLAVFVAATCHAQITCTTRTTRVIEAPDGARVVGTVDKPAYLILPDNSDGAIRWACDITFEGVTDIEPSIEAVEIETRQPCQVSQIEPFRYLIFGAGEVSVQLVDWTARASHSLTVTIPTDKPRPPPKPDDDDEEPDPPKPPDVEIPNKYGIGQVAYQYAVADDAEVNRQYEQIYRKAADFLYGKPSAKSIIPDGDPDANNPDRNVLAWMRYSADNIRCTNEAKCKAWAKWRTEVAKAANASQETRQYEVTDWYYSFIEVADALKAAR